MQITEWRTLPGWVSHRDHWYVLTDTHGRIEPFQELLAAVPKGARIIHLGDIGDRGPDSLGCYCELASRKDMTLVLGNHDLMLFQAMFDPESIFVRNKWLKLWWYNGGTDFFHRIKSDKAAQELVQSVLKRQILYHMDGNLFFVHSGMVPQYDFRELANYWRLSTQDLIFRPVPHLTWCGSGSRFWENTAATEWKGFDKKPFFIHGHRPCTRVAASECSPGSKSQVWPREDDWRIGVDDREGMTALEILKGKYRFYTLDGCGFF